MFVYCEWQFMSFTMHRKIGQPTDYDLWFFNNDATYFCVGCSWCISCNLKLSLHNDDVSSRFWRLKLDRFDFFFDEKILEKLWGCNEQFVRNSVFLERHIRIWRKKCYRFNDFWPPFIFKHQPYFGFNIHWCHFPLSFPNLAHFFSLMYFISGISGIYAFVLIADTF